MTDWPFRYREMSLMRILYITFGEYHWFRKWEGGLWQRFDCPLFQWHPMHYKLDYAVETEEPTPGTGGDE